MRSFGVRKNTSPVGNRWFGAHKLSSPRVQLSLPLEAPAARETILVSHEPARLSFAGAV